MTLLEAALAFSRRPAGRAALTVALKMQNYQAAALHVLSSPVESLRQHGEQGLREMLANDAGCSPEDAQAVIRELLELSANQPREHVKTPADRPAEPQAGQECAPPSAPLPVQERAAEKSTAPDTPRLPEAATSAAPLSPGEHPTAGTDDPTTGREEALDLRHMSVLQMMTALVGSGLKITHDEMNQVRRGQNTELARRVIPLIRAHRLQLETQPSSRFVHARAQLQHAVFTLFDLDCPDALAPLCLGHGLHEYQAFADLCPPELLGVVIGEKDFLRPPEHDTDPALLTPECLRALEDLAAVLLHSGHLLQITHLSTQLLEAGWNEDGLDRCLSAGGNAHLSLKAARADLLSPADTTGVYQLLSDLLHAARPQGHQIEELGDVQRSEAVRKGKHALKQAGARVNINDLAALLRVPVSQLTQLLGDMGAARFGLDVGLLPAETRGHA